MGRIGPVASQHEVDRLARGLEGGVVKAPLRVGGGIPGSNEEGVALAQRNLEMFGKPQEHLAARSRATSLKEADVARGNIGLGGKRELAEAPALAPAAEEFANRSARGAHDGRRRGHHGQTIALSVRWQQLPQT